MKSEREKIVREKNKSKGVIQRKEFGDEESNRNIQKVCKAR